MRRWRSVNAEQVSPEQLAGRRVDLDGFNVLTTVEAALSGGVVIVGRDGCYRDMASMHGSYRKVTETRPALMLIGEVLAELGTGECQWYLDQPVSNSGRLKRSSNNSGPSGSGRGARNWRPMSMPCWSVPRTWWRPPIAACSIAARAGSISPGKSSSDESRTRGWSRWTDVTVFMVNLPIYNPRFRPEEKMEGGTWGVID